MKTFGTIVALFLLVILLTLGSSLVQSWGASTLWGWFVARDYGHGPSYAAWFGLFSIIGFATESIHRSILKTKEAVNKEKTSFVVAIGHSCSGMFMVLLTVAVADCVKHIVGW